ncbi:AzlC family ABC transporter permease, partial [Campylobacter fetus]
MSKFEIFRSTIPVMMGYIPLGLAFGLYGVGSGLPVWVMSLTSIIVYAGSVEFLLVAFIISGASLSSVFFISFLLNFRHFFYTMAMLNEIKSLKNRMYFIYALTDE